MTISASSNCRSENIRVPTVIVTELKLRDVQRHIFGGHFVECADHAAFENRPETFNRVCVNCADNIFMRAVANESVLRIFAAQCVICAQVVRGEQTNLVRHRLADKVCQRLAVKSANHARHDIALALHSADDANLAGPASASAAAALVPMFIFILSANVGFINLDHAAKLLNVLDQRRADLMTHEPRGFVRTKSHVALNLQRAHSLFAGEHKVDNAEPLAERLVRVLENGPRDMGEPVAGFRRALVALPRPRAVRQLVRIDGPTTRAGNAIGPAALYEVSAASFLIGEHPLKFGDAHLMDGFGLLAGHRTISLPSHKREYSIVTGASQVRDNRLHGARIVM
jgi:hypothetical protein